MQEEVKESIYYQPGNKKRHRNHISQNNNGEWDDSNKVEDSLYASRGGIGGSHQFGQ